MTDQITCRTYLLRASSIYRATGLDDGPWARALYHLSLVYARLGDEDAPRTAGEEARALRLRITGTDAEEQEDGPGAYDALAGFLEV